MQQHKEAEYRRALKHYLTEEPTAQGQARMLRRREGHQGL